MFSESGAQFLVKKYDLHLKPEVQDAVEKAEHLSGETTLNTPTARIETYLSRLQNIFEPEPLEGHDHFDRKERNLSLIKEALHKNFVIKPDQIPESYWGTQQRIAREQGHGDIEVTEEMRENGAEIIIADQESSLDNWVDYLASDDAKYPLWLKYFAIRGVLGMSTYDKERHQFNKRDKSTVAPFPDLDREALSYVLDAVVKRQSPEFFALTEKVKQKKNELSGLKREYYIQEQEGGDLSALATGIEETKTLISSLSQEQALLVSSSLAIPDDSRSELRELLRDADLDKLYAWAIEKVTPAEESELLTTEGEWVKYEQGSDHMPLVESLQGHGTGWCTAGESTAETQLANGDFWVYYSKDKHGDNTIPRAAIRMEGGSIAEVRGIAAHQNLDPYIAKIVQDKLEKFPSGKAYEKKALDMRILTMIERKVKSGAGLDRDEVIFLYEMNSPIVGFGYQKDPRVAELRSQRNPEQDMLTFLDLSAEQIAHTKAEITSDSKAYLGALEPGVFSALQANGIEHVFTSFPEGRVERFTQPIGGKDVETLKEELLAKGGKINDYTKGMLESPDFTTLPEAESLDLVRLPVSAFGFTKGGRYPVF